MKIFLNDRVIEFVSESPLQHLPSDLIITYHSPGQLEESWLDFERYEKYRKFIIVSPAEITELPHGNEEVAPRPVSGMTPAFNEFFKLFKYVPAAGGLVKNEKGEYLFIHRLGFWDLPKGKIDKKDVRDPAAGIHDQGAARRAAVREVMEETGLRSVTITGALNPTWHIYTAKEKRVLKQTTWYEMEADSSQLLKPQTSEGIFLAKWTAPGAIHCILTHTYASIRELLLDLIF